jgi:3-methyladenine DNA glycosylase AlkD
MNLKSGDSTIYTAITFDIKSLSNPVRSQKDKYFHKYEGHKSYGLTLPQLRQIHQKYTKEIQNLNCPDVLKLAQKFYRTHIEEDVITGNFILSLHLDCLDMPAKSNYLDQISRHLISWSTVDDFTGKIIQPLLLKNPRSTLKLLRQWNQSSQFWQQRVSLVAFTRKVGESGRFTSEALKFCENFINTDQDLLRKAIGWALKDLLRGDKKTVLAYVKNLRRRGISSTITLYAIRDLKGPQRHQVLNIKPSIRK